MRRPLLETHIQATLKRDGGRCVACGAPSDLIISIMDSRLWDDQEFHIDGWLTMCVEHSRLALSGNLEPAELGNLAGIPEGRYLPPQFYPASRHDRWGNELRRSGRSLRGELFHLPDVQLAIAKRVAGGEFLPWASYPRTFALPWSDTSSRTDPILYDLRLLEGRRVIATEKMDGENITVYNSYYHGRNVEGKYHFSRDWLASWLGSVSPKIPYDLRVCGEYLFAQHGIPYRDLDTYFHGFSVWNDRDECLPWQECLKLFSEFAIKPVTVFYDGLFEQERIHSAWKRHCANDSEGYIVRSADKIPMSQFRRMCGKFVRSEYEQVDAIRRNIQSGIPIVTNTLKSVP